MLEKEPELSRYNALVLAKAGWQRGVVGIAASKLSEDFNKPVILLNIQDDLAAGSVRSIEGINIIRCIRENARFLNTYGGHPMAAGLSLHVDKLREFRAGLSRTIETHYKEIPTEKQLHIDTSLPFSNLNLNLVKEIESLAPFGNGNPPPVLVSHNLSVESSVELGKDKLHRKLILQDKNGETREALWWNSSEQPQPKEQFDLAYYLRLNEYKGQRQVVLEWIDWQEHQPAAVTLETPLYTHDIQDQRLSPRPMEMLENLAGQSDVCFWAEGLAKFGKFPVKNRMELEKSPALAILTPPPSFAVLQEALQRVLPARVILLRLHPPDDSLEGFLKQLSGLAKYAISHYDGKANLKKLAAVLGQTEELVESGLEWWACHGDITFNLLDDGSCRIGKAATATRTADQALEGLSRSIQNLLNENVAFRSFYTRADPLMLLRKTSPKSSDE
jgi:single-stranded-DNA-specific exonuclease